MIPRFIKGCIFCLLSISGAGKATSHDITTDMYVNSLYLAASRVWPELEHVWNTPIYRQLRLIVADDHNAWAIDSKSLTKIPYSEIQQRYLPVEYMYFQEIKWPDDRPTLFVSLGSKFSEEENTRLQKNEHPVPALFNLATHEAFHFFVQNKKWKKKFSNNESRAGSYPALASPRFYRNNIIRSLYATLQGDDNGLGYARYWYDLWKKNYQDDARFIRQTDIYEGSAYYVEMAAEVIAEGLAFGTEDYHRAVVNKMKEPSNFIYTNPDEESYTIGALSGFILNQNNIDWQSRVIQGLPPLELLLENTLPIIQQHDSVLEEMVNYSINKLNSDIAHLIAGFIEKYHSSGVTKIFISSDTSGSYAIGDGIFRTQNFAHDLMVGLNSSSKWRGGSYHVREAVAAAINNYSECGENDGFLVLYSGTLPSNHKGRLVIESDGLSLDIAYPEGLKKNQTICIF